jgi:DNA-binding NtrC family response regulator
LPGHQPPADAEFGTNDDLTNAVELYEKSHIERTLGKTAGDTSRAAVSLGSASRRLYRKIEKWEIRD